MEMMQADGWGRKGALWICNAREAVPEVISVDGDPRAMDLAHTRTVKSSGMSRYRVDFLCDGRHSSVLCMQVDVQQLEQSAA